MFRELAPEYTDEAKRLRSGGMGWTAVIDTLLVRLTEEKGVRAQQVLDALDSIPVFEELPQVVRELRAAGYENVIISDANTLYIEHLLRRLGVRCAPRTTAPTHAPRALTRERSDEFAAIHTNKAWVDDRTGALRVAPYHENTTCARCPINLCKGAVLRAHVLEQEPEHVVYVGDGGGDYCPSSLLRGSDHVLAREAFPLAKVIAREPASVAAAVCLWADGPGLARLLRAAARIV